MIGPIQFDSSVGGGFTFDSVGQVGGSTRTDASSSSSSSSLSASSSGGVSSLAQTALSVQSQVDNLLASFGPKVAGDQQLRMMIAMLILQALLGRDENSTTNKASELAGLAGGLNAFGRPSQVALFSETNIVQIQHQSTLVYSDQAVQTTTEGGLGGDGSPGSRLDVTG